jgi:hypothetical protein
MNRDIRSQRLFACSCFAIALLTSPNSQAAAPVYFDLGGLIVYGALYLLGLIVFPFVIGFSKEKGSKRFWAWVFAVYIIGPVTYIFVEVKSNSMRNERIMEETKVGEQRNLEAFGNYCKGRQRIVHSRAPQADGASLVIRIEKGFTGVAWQFNAFPLFEYLGRKRDTCARTGVNVLEGVYDGAYSKEKNGYENEIRRYALCTDEKWAVVPDVQSRFELVLGKTGSKDSVPWGGEGGRWMSNSSVQIVDRLTGNILAEDTIYFLRYDTGEGGCPSGMDQLSSLLAEVFGHQ